MTKMVAMDGEFDFHDEEIMKWWWWYWQNYDNDDDDDTRAGEEGGWGWNQWWLQFMVSLFSWLWWERWWAIWNDDADYDEILNVLIEAPFFGKSSFPE